MQISRINYNELPDNEFETIKAGTYPAIITKCEYGLTKNSDNSMLTFTFKITEGKYEKRLLSYNIMMSYNGMSDKAGNVNKQKLKTLMNSIGLTHDVEDTDEFLNGECLITVDVDESGKNNIKTVRPLDQSNLSPAPVQNEAPEKLSRDTNARTYAAAPSRPAPRRRGE